MTFWGNCMYSPPATDKASSLTCNGGDSQVLLSMARLPKPGSDNNQWGDILNDFLLVAHTEDGTLRVTEQIAAKVTLGGDLGGSVDSPEVTSVHLDQPLPVSQGGTGSTTQLFPIPRGAWTPQTAYKVNDLVTSGRSTWRCTAAHTSSNVFQSQVISGFWEQWSPRNLMFNVMDYGAKVDGMTDDTAAVQNAVAAAFNAGAGRCLFRKVFAWSAKPLSCASMCGSRELACLQPRSNCCLEPIATS